MSRKDTPPPSPEPSSHLFSLDDFLSKKPGDGLNLRGNVWTYQKSVLISRYLHWFLAITKNGVYIDAFAGPQETDNGGESWSARKVLENRSKFLNQAWLCELDPKKHAALDELKEEFCEGDRNISHDRCVKVFKGDCNDLIPDALRTFPYHRKKACFAVLDQRTHECRWDLVQTLARDKPTRKIELFYFLAQGCVSFPSRGTG